MLSGGGHDLPQKFLQIKQDDKFFSRMLSKESSKAEASFRVLYYGGAGGAVPFRWESQPGTPKHPLSHTSLPPLTPPPSYQFTTPKTKSMQKRSKPNFLFTIFPRKNSKKNHVSPSFSSSSVSSSCSSNSSFSLPPTPMRSCRGWWLSRSRSTLHFGVDHHDDDDDEQAAGFSASSSCFGVKRMDFPKIFAAAGPR